jgi:hypothetical protein
VPASGTRANKNSSIRIIGTKQGLITTSVIWRKVSSRLYFLDDKKKQINNNFWAQFPLRATNAT